MKKDITVVAEKRDSRGKNEARRLRVSGSIPAILYGTGTDPVALAINPKEVTRILHSKTGHNTIFNVEVKSGETTAVMIVDWQEDPIKGRLLHADLKRIDLTKRLAVKVPVYVTGEAQGVKLQGGLLELIVREVEVECLPEDIPEHFTIDVTELMLGQAKRAGDLEIGGAVKLISPPEAVIAHVVAIRIEVEAPVEEVAAVEGATPAEPEVIKKGKKEEEGPAEEKKK